MNKYNRGYNQLKSYQPNPFHYYKHTNQYTLPQSWKPYAVMGISTIVAILIVFYGLVLLIPQV